MSNQIHIIQNAITTTISEIFRGDFRRICEVKKAVLHLEAIYFCHGTCYLLKRENMPIKDQLALYQRIELIPQSTTEFFENNRECIINNWPEESALAAKPEVIFKKYSLIGGLEDFAAQFCDTLSRNTDFTAAVTDRDSIVAVAGAGKRELLGKNLSPQLEQIMEQRSIYQYRSGQERLPVSESAGQYAAAVAAPILCGGDVLGLVLFVSAEDRLPGEGEYKLAQAVAGFLGKHMEA